MTTYTHIIGPGYPYTPETSDEYPRIPVADVAQFHATFELLEDEGKIDALGGSEWRGTLTRAVLEALDVPWTLEAATLLRQVINYAQQVGWDDHELDLPLNVRGA